MYVCQMACKFRWGGGWRSWLVGILVCDFQHFRVSMVLSDHHCHCTKNFHSALLYLQYALLLSHSKQVHAVIIVPISKPITTANVLKLFLCAYKHFVFWKHAHSREWVFCRILFFAMASFVHACISEFVCVLSACEKAIECSCTSAIGMK